MAKNNWLEFTEEQIEKYRQQFIKNTLRRASYRWPWRNLAASSARIERGVYQCQKCKQKVVNKDKKVDHVSPVVDPKKGFQGWDMYARRLLVSIDGFQILCNTCHLEKTNEERLIRKAAKQKIGSK